MKSKEPNRAEAMSDDLEVINIVTVEDEYVSPVFAIIDSISMGY